MNRFKNILVAFDGSSDSKRALKTAETLALDNRAKLTVVYVHDKSLDRVANYESPVTDDLHAHQAEPYIGTGTIPTHTEINAGAENLPPQKQAIVHDNEPDIILSNARIQLESDIDVKLETLIGHAANVINDYAKDHAIDLIVIGNRGLSGIKKLVMGSVSQKVTNDAECAVLVVK